MKKLLMLVLTLALFSFVVPEDKKITIFMIGDSTMADKNLEKENQERGWGQALPMHLQGNVVVDNHAKNGRSSKSFIDEGRWDKVLEKIKPGDYVFIQFGHNDEKKDEARHTDPYTSYAANLTKFIRETKARGGNPVVFNSIVRRKFNGDKLTDTHGEYIVVPEQVAKAEGVPFVDANTITHKLVEAYGNEVSKRLFMWIEPGKYEFCPKGKQDDTHLNIQGADIVSDLLIRATAKVVPALAQYVKPEVKGLESALPQSFFPAMGAKNVCVDTHLVLTFNSPVTAGNSGKIRVYEIISEDDALEALVDSLDLSIPSGPTESREYGPECDYTKIPYDYARSTVPTNRDTKAGTPSGTAEPTPPEYQLNIIGGFTDAFHFHPVITHGNTATIYLHNNILQYGHSYRVTIDKSVLNTEGFEGINNWTFEVKKDKSASTNLYVKADGSGDFCTLQGALDHIPDFSNTHYYIYVGEGDFEEIVYARNKSNVTITGAGMDKTKVHYANNEVFNPHPLLVKTNERPGTFPSRRAAVDFDNCRDFVLRDITFATDLTGQAEGLLLNGEHFDLKNVRIIGSGDALQANGTIYMEDSEIIGGWDAILSRGTVFAKHCHFVNDGGPFSWIRNTKGHHGLVFVECTLGTNNNTPFDFARCSTNKKATYPDAEMVLINCKAHDVIPSGWSSLGEPTVTMLEFNTTSTVTGKPFDTSQRHKYSRQLDAKKDRKLIEKYSNPRWVLDGWNPRKE